MDTTEKQRQELENMVNSQTDPTSGLAINCRNCIHCKHKYVSTSYYDECMKAGGYFCSHVIGIPELFGNICRNHSAWAPRNKSILELLTDKIRSILS
jgi:hypothetical protein